MTRNRSAVFFLIGSFFYFLALFISIYPDVFFFGQSFVKRDIFRYYYPVWQFSIDQIKNGHFPLWNPYSSYGTPFLANIQSCQLYPLSFILYLPNYGWAFNFYILIHLTLASFFVCFWMRDCGASRLASILSGLSYGLGGFMMSCVNVTISICSICYFPLGLYFLRRAFVDASPKWKVLSALVLLFQYLAGDPAIFFASVLIYTLAGFYQAAEFFMRNKRINFNALGCVLWILGIFLCVSAPHLLLFIEFLFHSNRLAGSLDTASRWSLYYNDLISIAVPQFSDISSYFMDYWSRQSWVQNNYCGATVLFLAALAVLGKRSSIINKHLILLVFSVLISLGKWGGIYSLFYYFFPFFKFIRYPARFMFLFSFALSCLAGFGLDALRQAWSQKSDTASKESWKKFVFPSALSCLFGVTAVFFYFTFQIKEDFFIAMKGRLEAWSGLGWSVETVKECLLPFLMNLRRSLVLACFTGLLIWLAWSRRTGIFLILVLLVSLVFIDLVEVNVVEVRAGVEWMDIDSPIQQVLAEDKSLFRYAASPQAMNLFRDPGKYPTMYHAFYNLADGLAPNAHLKRKLAYFGGYDSLYLKEGVDLSKTYRMAKPENSRGFLNMINAKYIINSDPAFAAFYPKIRETDIGDLCLNEQALPRAFLVEKAQKKPLAEIPEYIFRQDFNAREVLYLSDSETVDLTLLEERLDLKDDTVIEAYQAENVKIRVSSSSEKWLFMSDSFYPGWTARINGKPSKTYRANYAFRAVRVPAGISEVTWKYEPILFKIGFTIGLLSWCVCLAVLILNRVRVKREKMT